MPFTKQALLLFAALTVGVSAIAWIVAQPSRAESMSPLPLAASASKACTLGDGHSPAINITIEWTDSTSESFFRAGDVFNLSLLGEGVTKLASGGTIEFPSGVNKDGDGSFAVCVKGKNCVYPGGRLIVKPTTTGQPFDGMLRWLQGDAVGLREHVVNFKADWADVGPDCD